ncbi:MAG TPA: DUF998 domain-containing protein [Thermoplasmata archaeon]|nr:DUF998 domain-containing protein [Thermoplasmata archaeon]
MAGLGPLVPRAAHRAGGLLLIATVEFTAAMGIAQAGYPGYSDVTNAISDLGNSNRSPWFLVFNTALVAFGLIGLWATAWLVPAFRPKTTARVGLVILAAAFIGAIGVGLAPEEVHPSWHAGFAFLAFLGSGLALLFLALAMLRDTRWEGMRLYTAVSGAIVLGAIAALLSIGTSSVEFGAVERVVVAPALVWMGVAGVHLWRMPVYDPTGARTTEPSNG